MTALVIVLLLTNVATLAVVALLVRRRRSEPVAELDIRVTETLASASRSVAPGSSVGRTRRVISVEILNPIELASGRGRMFGIAGSFVPHLTRRIVYDQTARQLREQLTAHNVVADVRIHVITPQPTDATRPAEIAPPIAAVEVVDDEQWDD